MRGWGFDIPHTVWYSMSDQKRSYISLYFSDGTANSRKKRDVTLAFDPDDELYLVCRRLGSSGIKHAMGIFSYAELLKAARKEDRSLGNYIKHKLRVTLLHEQKNSSC